MTSAVNSPLVQLVSLIPVVNFPPVSMMVNLPLAPLVSLIPEANLPPVTTILAANYGGNNTGGKFATGVNNM
jgi:hypothetical protein